MSFLLEASSGYACCCAVDRALLPKPLFLGLGSAPVSFPYLACAMAVQLTEDDIRRMVASWSPELRSAILHVLRSYDEAVGAAVNTDRSQTGSSSGNAVPEQPAAGTPMRRSGFWCGIPCECCNGVGTCNRSGPHTHHSCLVCRRIQQDARKQRHAWRE